MNSRILSFVPSTLYSRATISHITNVRNWPKSSTGNRQVFDIVGINDNHSNRKPKIIFVLGGMNLGYISALILISQ